jgi:hypothetical protein
MGTPCLRLRGNDRTIGILLQSRQQQRRVFNPDAGAQRITLLVIPGN